ncbi:MAG: ABC transporter permease [bacterium]|nr:ABC transporter permease [bacterium]
MIRYFFQMLRIHFQAGRSLYALTVFGVALGVASVLSIQIINRNALAAFEGSVVAVSGEADFSILGRTPTFSETLYPKVLAEPGVHTAWPLYRVNVALLGRERFFLDVVGVDFFAPMRVPWQGQPGDLSASLSDRGWAAVTPQLAEKMGWAVGDSFGVASGSRQVWLKVGALVDFQRLSPLASPKLVVMDIAQAQDLLGRLGQIHQIDVRAMPGTDVQDLQMRLQRKLGSGVQVMTPEQRGQQAEGLMAAFRLNLTALSLISLFVGLFLVYSSTQASLVRRRAEFGMLRSIGATRGQVLGLILGEVALLGTLGVAFGLPMGYWAAEANVELVSATLSNLYLLEEISTLELPFWLYGLAGAIGIGGAVGGAILPALDMSRRDTRTLLSTFTLHEAIGSQAPRLFGLGVGIMVLSGVWYPIWGRQWQPAGFVLAVALLFGMPLLVPGVIQGVCGQIRVRGFGLGYSLKALGVHLQTSAFAVASLTIAVSMLIGITLMVGSFRKTLEVWIETSIRADIYLSPASWRGRGDTAFLEDELVSEIGVHPGVVAVDRLRGFPAYSGDHRVALAGVEVGLPDGEARFPLLLGDPASVFRQVEEEGAVLVGETLSRQLDVWPGDVLPLTVSDGEHGFPIAGVYYDYNTQGGTVIMDLKTLETHFGAGPVNSVALYLAGGKDADVVVDELKERFPNRALEIRSNRRLREEILKIFDQTFAVTRLLQGMSLLIAVCGVTLMLLVLAQERVSELALYRALGASRGQVFRLFVGKGLGRGMLGLGLGAVGGVLLAGILIFVINRAYFGWTIQVFWPWGPVLEQVGTILLAAVGASVYPAVKASRTTGMELSRDDV